MIERITDTDDPRIARYRNISDRELLRADGSFVAEGRLVVRRVIERQADAVRSVLVNDAAHRSLEPLLARLPQHVPIFVCQARDFPAMTGFDMHRGCLALVERPRPLSVGEVVDAALGRAPSYAGEPAREADARATLVILEGVTNADNVGGVFRNAAAFGAGGVLLDPSSCDPWYRKAIRTSMAAVLRVPFARLESWPGGLDALRDAGFRIAALTPREPAIAVGDFAESRPSHLALLVGTEGAGLTAAAEAAADYRVRIPIAAGVDSLNLAVAVGIALHRLR